MVRFGRKFGFLLAMLFSLFIGNSAFAQGNMPTPHFPFSYQLKINVENELELKVGDQYAFTATLKDSNHQIIPTVFEWSLSDTSIGEIDSTGLFTAMNAGSGYVRVGAPQFGVSDSVKIKIEKNDSDSSGTSSSYKLIIHPREDVEVEVGEQIHFFTGIRNSNQQMMPVRAQWSLSDTSIGQIDSTGLFTAVNPGNAYAIVLIPDFGLVDSVFIQVKAPKDSSDNNDGKENYGKRNASSMQIQITPDQAELVIGQQVTFHVEILDSTGTPVTLPISWAVRGQSIGTIDDTGTFTATANGRGLVVATAGNLSVRARIKVGEENKGWHNQGNRDHAKWEIKITPGEAKLAIGQQVQFTASVYDSTGALVDTTVTWILDGWPIGSVDSTGLFTATAFGAGVVRAYLGRAHAEAEIKVGSFFGNGHSHGFPGHNGNNDYELVILPEDTVLHVGDSLRFVAKLLDPNGTPIDTVLHWKLKGDDIGIIDSTGYFVATQPGFALVKARAGHENADASIQVISSVADTSNAKSILVKTCLPNGFELPDSMVIREGNMIKFRGFPFPFNLLNGGLLTIPSGALHENITLTIYLPEFADFDSSHVNFKNKILNAVEFEVSVNNQAIHPYYFDKPLKLSLPYRPQLLDSLGLTVNDLGIFFYSGANYDSTGIKNMVIDSTNNRIFADVYHFSTLVLSGKNVATSLNSEKNLASLPTQLTLYQNYPNPFNPETRISYVLPTEHQVTVRIFNMLGQEIKTLINQKQTAGIHTVRWNGTDQFGQKVGSGIYFYQVKSGNISIVKKMILMK